MKLSSLSKAVVLSLCSVSSAMANNAVDRTELWGGAGLAIGFLDESIESQDKGKTNTNDFSSKLDIGYDFNDYIGVYGSYDYMQHVLVKDNLHIGTIGIKGREQLTDDLTLFGKLGGSYLFGEKNDSGLIGVIGLGLEYQLTHAVSTRIGIDYYNDLNVDVNRTGDLTQVYWGMSYRFGQPATPMVVTNTVEIIREVPVEVIKEVYVKIITENYKTLFLHDSSVLMSIKSLEVPLDVLKSDERLTVRITGYTDSTGTAKYNQWMSEKRAKSVTDYFESNGISATRITAIGKGAADPIASNKTKRGRAQNRRVDISITSENIN